MSRALGQAIDEGYSLSGYEANALFLNRADNTWVDVGVAAGVGSWEDGRGFSLLDFDRDGDLDIALRTGSPSRPVRFYENHVGQRSHFLALRLEEESPGNSEAVGAKILLRSKGKTQVRFVQAGTGYLSQHTRTVFFGLGREADADVLEVIWPDGQRERFERLRANQFLTLRRGAAPEPGRAAPFLKNMPP